MTAGAHGRAALGGHDRVVAEALREIEVERIVARIWARDHTVWAPEPAGIANRLGWLDIAERMVSEQRRLAARADGVIRDGFTDVLLLGMGGSSLAPEVFGKVFGGETASRLRLAVLDSTDPGSVLAHAERLDPSRTLFVVSSKSGGTEETLSFFRFFYNWMADTVGPEQTGRHFVAITDPGSKLHTLAEELGFRASFLNDPEIGGRYAALSYVGLVPAALVGVDLERLLERACGMVASCRPERSTAENPAAWLGAILGELAKAGRDKATFVLSPRVAAFGDWVEQLIAESTGKQGMGIVPVVGEPIGPPEVYGDDRLFVYLRLEGDVAYDRAVQALQEAGHPVVRFDLSDAYDLGGQFFLWELATAVAGHRLGSNPFDQPDVEAAKALARQAVGAYRETGRLPEDVAAPPTAEALCDFLARAECGDYIAVQAFIQPTAENDRALLGLRKRMRDTMRLATTVGYGPRFLHSTGQLHKGGPAHGMFLQLTSDPLRDVAIPDAVGQSGSTMTFGLLKMAQALGDKQALENAGRRVARFHLGTDVTGGLENLAGMAL